jgi:hypothetical protein
MPRLHPNPKFLEFMADPDLRGELNRQLLNTPPQPDGTKIIELTDKKGRKLKFRMTYPFQQLTHS